MAVFDGFGPDKTVAAVLNCNIYWRSYFDGLLPPGSNGIIVILENTCGQKYTYEVNGIQSSFVGHGDLHSSRYDHLRTGTSIESIIDRRRGNETGGGFQSDERDGCHYSIRVYPSEEFEESRYSNKPWAYAVILAALFLFTSSIFLTYDWMVARRQKLVMKSAVQSGKLVSSLFPEEVRDRLYEEQERNAAAKKCNGWQLKQQQHQNPSETAMEPKKAIARLYPETTLFFGDLCGFTKWSSDRTPEQVFEVRTVLWRRFLLSHISSKSLT